MRRLTPFMLLLAIAVLMGCGGGKGAKNSSGLPEAKYLKDTNRAVMVVQVDKALNSELGKLLPLDALKAQAGEKFQPESVKRIMVGLPVAVSDAVMSETQPMVAVVLFKEGTDLSSLKAELANFPTKEAAGKTYHELPGSEGMGGYLDEEGGMFVAGHIGPLEGALGDGTPSSMTENVKANLNQDIYMYMNFAAVRDDLDKVMGGEEAPPQAKEMQESLQQVEWMEWMISLSGDTLMHMHIQTADSDAAIKINNLIQQGLGMVKPFVATATEDPMLLGKEAIDGMQIDVSGAMLEVSVPRPNDFVNRIKKMMPPMGPPTQ